jgi:predicted Rossmann-fold nucleotide-binding protein
MNEKNLSIMAQKLHPGLQPKRIGISGGASIDETAGRFCKVLGALLASHEGPILVSGGCKRRKSNLKEFSTDYWTIEGATEKLNNDEKIHARIETILPDEETPKIEKFDTGNVIKLYKKTPQARRFVFVSSIDVLVAVAGGAGTTQNIDLAIALGVPVLPLPMFGGKAKEYWKDYSKQIKEWFGMNDELYEKWSAMKFSGEDDPRIPDVAAHVANYLIGRLKPTCMIIMPFRKAYDKLYDVAIEPAVDEEDFLPVRTDRLNATGDIIEMIHKGLATCDCAVAILTELRPNVMYELGRAHAFQKPVLILMESKTTPLPFDVDKHSVIFYKDVDEQLKEKIKTTLQQVRNTYLPGRYLRFSQ